MEETVEKSMKRHTGGLKPSAVAANFGVSESIHKILASQQIEKSSSLHKFMNFGRAWCFASWWRLGSTESCV
jgi:hypothetical protein